MDSGVVARIVVGKDNLAILAVDSVVDFVGTLLDGNHYAKEMVYFSVQ